MSVTFGPGVKAFGGNIYITDPAAFLIEGSISVSCDAGAVTYTQAAVNSASNFFGFTSPTDVTACSFTSGGVGQFVTVDNMITGA